MCKTNLSNRRGGGCRGRGGKDFGSAAATENKNQDFYENSENEKIAKNIEKIDKNIDFGGAAKNGHRHQILREKLPL